MRRARQAPRGDGNAVAPGLAARPGRSVALPRVGTCLDCGARFRVPEATTARRGRCGKCGGVVPIPEAAAVAAAPATAPKAPRATTPPHARRPAPVLPIAAAAVLGLALVAWLLFFRDAGARPAAPPWSGGDEAGVASRGLLPAEHATSVPEITVDAAPQLIDDVPAVPSPEPLDPAVRVQEPPRPAGEPTDVGPRDHDG